MARSLLKFLKKEEEEITRVVDEETIEGDIAEEKIVEEEDFVAEEAAEEEMEEAEKTAEKEMDEAPRPSEEFLKLSRIFSAAAYREILKTEKKNVISCPLSVEFLLALTLNGGRNQTAEEIRQALNFSDMNNSRINSEIQSALHYLDANNRRKTHVVNKMYIKEKFPVKNEFKNLAKEYYKVEIENINFDKKAKAAETINKWVKQQTNNLIKKLITKDSINEYTRLILVNTLYFKCDWELKFSLRCTKKIKFYKSPTEVIKVSAMSYPDKLYMNYYECDVINAQFLEIMLQSGDASMVFVLPKERDGLESVEKHMEEILSGASFIEEEVVLAIPKFRIETKIDFKEVLKNLGVETVFDDFIADLSGIADGDDKVCVNEVIQKCFVDVNEDGVEAGAATGEDFIMMMCASSPIPFIADHPFMFYIKVQRMVIFVGRVTEPKY